MEGAVQDVCAPLVSVIWSWSSETGMDETGEGEGFMKTQMAGFQALYGSCRVAGEGCILDQIFQAFPCRGHFKTSS